jgi:hypothetical protein
VALLVALVTAFFGFRRSPLAVEAYASCFYFRLRSKLLRLVSGDELLPVRAFDFTR